jgi:acyl-CoA thioesterase YciA
MVEESESENVPDQLKPPSPEPAIRVVMMPRDTNAEGTIFGGVILSLIDQAAYVEAIRQKHRRYVTVAFNTVEFHEPVFMGDVLSLYAEATRIGRTSMTIHVRVLARRRTDPDQLVKVTEADVVFVSIDDQGRPAPVFS